MDIVKVKYPPFFREPLEFPPSILSDNVSLERVALIAFNRAAIYSDLRDGARLIDGRWNGKVIPLGGTLAIYRSPEYRYFVRLPVDGPLEPWPALETIMLPIAIYLGAELPSQTDQAAIEAVSAALEQAVEYIYDPQRTVVAAEDCLRFRWPEYYSAEYICQKRIYSNKTMGGAVVRAFGMFGTRDVAYCDFSDKAALDSWAASMTTGEKVMDFFRVVQVQVEPWWEVRFRPSGGPYY